MAGIRDGCGRADAGVVGAVPASFGSDGRDRPFSVTYFEDFSAARKREDITTLATLADIIGSTTAPAKSQLPWLKLAQFGDRRSEKNSLRHDANVLAITGVELDYDGDVMTIDEAADLLLQADVLSLIYASPSHAAGKPRWRVLCPTSVELPPDRRRHLMGRLNGVLRGAASGESWTLSQSYYYGRVGANPDHRVEIIDGTPIDLLDELDPGWRGKAETKVWSNASNGTGKSPRSGPIDEQALTQQIVSGSSYHAASVRLLGRWALDGVPMMAARSRLQAAMKNVPEADRDDRWRARHADIDRCLEDIYLKEATTRDRAEHSGARPPPRQADAVGGGAISTLPTHWLGDLLDDDSPMPEDWIGPRVLTPEGMLVLAGPPKVGKSDLLLHLLIHAAAGRPFLAFTFPRPLRIFHLQAEIDYHYLRERLQRSGIDPSVLRAARTNLAVTSKLRILLDESGVNQVVAVMRERLGDAPPDIICVDPIRNLFDGGTPESGENDNTGMLFFLQQRVEALRAEVSPRAGVILIHHTRKSSKSQVLEDPFQAISGASSLRSYYTSGILMHRPDEAKPEIQLEIELRNGPAMGPMQIVKRDGQWVEVDQCAQRITSRDIGRRRDAERDRRRDVIVDLIESEGRDGRLYTANQFAERFENESGLGGSDSIRKRISVLATKGWVKFTRTVVGATLPATKSSHGYLCVEGMVMPGDDERIDPATGEVTPVMVRVLPTLRKCPETGASLPVEDPMVWVYHDDRDPSP